ncbi:MAG: hypothetical protein RL885_08200 [Planctomycetota bacterium]
MRMLLPVGLWALAVLACSATACSEGSANKSEQENPPAAIEPDESQSRPTIFDQPQGELLELTGDDDAKMKKLLDLAVEKAGGLEAWKKLDTLVYRVRERNFNLKNGVMMWELTRSFFMKPHQQQYRMEDYTEGGNPHFMVYDGREGFMKVDGKLLRNVESRESAREELLTEARFLSMPFCLLADTVEKKYVGPADWQGRKVHKVMAVFLEGLESRIEPDRYEIIFDGSAGQVIGARQLLVIKGRDAERNRGFLNFEKVGGLSLADYRVQFGPKASAERPRVTRELSLFQVNPELDDALFLMPSESGSDEFYRANLERVTAELEEIRRQRNERTQELIDKGLIEDPSAKDQSDDDGEGEEEEGDGPGPR